jgi:hypothetical protein
MRTHRARALLIVTLLLLTGHVFVPVAASTGTTAATTLAKLRVVAEPQRVGYDRELFPHWLDQDADSCDARAEVLLEESLKAVRKSAGCRLHNGSWKSIYDGVSYSTPTGLDIDHVVALAEAWDSGASTWSQQDRSAFANDLGSPWSLVAVSARSNRMKSDLDAADWQPSTKYGRCWLATATVITKWRWSLSVDPAEREALLRQIRACPASRVNLPLKINLTPSPTGVDLETKTPTPMPSDSSSPTPGNDVRVKVSPSHQGNCPTTHPVKGNINSTGERIYHLPTSTYYTRTRAESCFSDTTAAEIYGFRPPR